MMSNYLYLLLFVFFAYVIVMFYEARYRIRKHKNTKLKEFTLSDGRVIQLPSTIDELVEVELHKENGSVYVFNSQNNQFLFQDTVESFQREVGDLDAVNGDFSELIDRIAIYFPAKIKSVHPKFFSNRRIHVIIRTKNDSI